MEVVVARPPLKIRTWQPTKPRTQGETMDEKTEEEGDPGESAMLPKSILAGKAFEPGTNSF